MASIRVCPVCNAENAPSAQRCASCSAMLIGVDLTEKGDTGATFTDVPVPPAAAAAAVPLRCPHADCGQLNAANAERCVYCDRPMELPAPAAPALRAAIRWPWTEEVVIDGCLVVGREPPAPAALASRLAREYGNVSRRHAELRVADGALWIVDLGSVNGTFVNETRIAPNQPVRLVNGAKLRFAANLVAQVAIGEA
jgi:hypothetical protein